MALGIEHGERLFGLPLIAHEKTQLLIVGTFPSQESLRKQEYYANTRNLFWEFISAAYEDDYRALPYQTRTARLLAHRVGIWDVYASCRRRGSSDNAICDEVLNDFAELLRVVRSLRMIAFNGMNAAKHAPVLQDLGYSVTRLPSSSPANTHATQAEKTREWAALLRQFSLTPVQLLKPFIPLQPVDAELIRQGIHEGRE